jgi:hypothetical protein
MAKAVNDERIFLLMQLLSPLTSQMLMVVIVMLS